jgi:hypothetical protein
MTDNMASEVPELPAEVQSVSPIISADSKLSESEVEAPTKPIIEVPARDAGPPKENARGYPPRSPRDRFNPKAGQFLPKRALPKHWMTQCRWTMPPMDNGRGVDNCRFGIDCHFGHPGEEYFEYPGVKQRFRDAVNMTIVGGAWIRPGSPVVYTLAGVVNQHHWYQRHGYTFYPNYAGYCGQPRPPMYHQPQQVYYPPPVHYQPIPYSPTASVFPSVNTPINPVVTNGSQTDAEPKTKSVEIPSEKSADKAPEPTIVCSPESTSTRSVLQGERTPGRLCTPGSGATFVPVVRKKRAGRRSPSTGSSGDYSSSVSEKSNGNDFASERATYTPSDEKIAIKNQKAASVAN